MKTEFANKLLERMIYQCSLLRSNDFIYWDWNYLSTIVEVTTGLKLDEAQLIKISSTIQNATRRFNLREGITPKDDTLPKRYFDEPLGKDGKTIRREDLQRMLMDYYVLRGWSPEGIPGS